MAGRKALWALTRVLPVVTALVLLLASCTPGDAPERELMIEDLEANQALWQSHGLVDYQVTIDIDSGGVLGGVGQLLVRNGTVVEVARDGWPADPAYYRTWTVDDLFITVTDLIARDVYSLEVQYHPDLGFPVLVRAQDYPDVTDGLRFTVEGFSNPGKSPVLGGDYLEIQQDS